MITLGAGNIVDLQGYQGLETFFIGWTTVATLSALAIWLLDYSNGGQYYFSIPPPVMEVKWRLDLQVKIQKIL